MIPIRIQIINNKQKRAALVGCTLFLRLWGLWLLCAFYGLFYLLFATCLRQDKKVDNVGLNHTYTYCMNYKEEGFAYYSMYRAVKEQYQRLVEITYTKPKSNTGVT